MMIYTPHILEEMYLGLEDNGYQFRGITKRFPLATRHFKTKLKNRYYWLYGFIILVLGTGAATNSLHFDYQGGSAYVITTFSWAVGLIGSLAAIFAGYSLVTSDQASGRIRLILKLPYTRWRYAFEKFLGEAFAVIAFTSLATVTGFAVSTALYGLPPVLPAIGILVVQAGNLLVWLSLAMAVSMVVKTGRRAVAVLMVLFLSTWVWEGVANSILRGIGEQSVAVRLFAYRLEPYRAYSVTVNWMLGLPNSDLMAPLLMEHVDPNGSIIIGPGIVSELVGDIPWFLSEWVSALVLILWGTVPMLLAYRRFKTADIS
ncbi:ABC transporter permease subunit [Halogeometricum borinquense]|uniref:ABC transporter permease subunit n=2 Tax=Halogeometricum borinquense TaxID=60847 RepID=A0A6C0UM64_9EURY|nr:ABC transporter permease subunit [Halogeometricum borinquense]